MNQSDTSSPVSSRFAPRRTARRGITARSLVAFGLALVAGVGVVACGSTQHNAVDSSANSREPLPVTMEVRGPATATARAGVVPEPTSWNIKLFNTSGASTAWTLRSDQRWLRLSVEQGVLGPRASTWVDVTLDVVGVRGLAVGEHRARVSIGGRAGHAPTADVAQFVLDVVPDASAPTDDGVHAAPPQRGATGGGASLPVSDVPQGMPGDDGWTDLAPSADSRLVYVSSSTGNDGNDGLTPQTPKASIAAGMALLRNGHPDWLQLRRGDTWTGTLGQWIVSGRSASEPAVVSTYGPSTSRPRIATGSGDGLVTLQTSTSPARLEHVRFVGLHFQANGYDGGAAEPRGIRWHVPFEDILVEDCLIEGYHTNIVIEPLGEQGHDFRLRRSVVVDAFTTHASHSQGLYVSNTDGVLLAQNVFDHNGWREDVAGATPTIFRHNVYLQTDVSSVRAVGNVFANGASHGLQARQGGAVENNLFVGNAIALLLGSNNATTGPIRFAARRNVILAGRDISPSLPRGFGIDVPAAASGTIENNVIANQAQAGFPIAISLYDGSTPSGLQDVVVEDNVVYEWHGPIIFQGASPRVQGVVFRRNTIVENTDDDVLLHHANPPAPGVMTCAENRVWSRRAPVNSWCRLGTGNVSLDAWKAALGDTTSVALSPDFVDPTRDVEAYDAWLGGPGTRASFLANARRLSRETWDERWTAAAANDWIRAGFRTE